MICGDGRLIETVDWILMIDFYNGSSRSKKKEVGQAFYAGVG